MTKYQEVSLVAVALFVRMLTACLYDSTITMYTAYGAMRIRNKVLKYVVERWKQSFVGTSALELADSISLTYGEVTRRLEILVSRGTVYLRSARLGQPTEFRELKLENGKIIRFPANWEMVDTVIAFPERHVLVEVFKEEGKDYGVFTNRLHRGDSQLSHCFFRQDVLDKYLQYPDRYLISDTIVSGYILTKDAYYFSLPEDKRDKETFAEIRYGKRKLKEGGITIAAIAIDLSGLPYQEQQYWASHEIEEGIEFVQKDPEFEKYYRMMFEGEWVSYEDPLQEIRNVVECINNLIDRSVCGKLFRNTSENPHLRYIVRNTVKAYQDVHKELYKLLGADSLDKNVLQALLKKLGAKEEELRDQNGKEKKALGLFKLFVINFCNADFAAIKRCFDARVADAHIIETINLPKDDLTWRFRIDCGEILKTLKRIESYLKKSL